MTTERKKISLPGKSAALRIVRMSARAHLPTYATPGAAAFDLRAMSVGGDRPVSDGIDWGVAISPGGTAVFGTGLKVAVPEGYVLQVFSRSGHGFKYGVSLVNGTGIIDSDYRGELQIGLRNDSLTPFRLSRGDRIAQAMLVALPRVDFEEVESLDATERGEGGFGSTGVA